MAPTPRRKPNLEGAALRVSQLATRAESLRAFRLAALGVVADLVRYDGALLHALSPRVPLGTAALVGIDPGKLARSQHSWDDLAVELGALRQAANERVATSLDEVFVAGSRIHARVARKLYGLFRMRSLCIVHLVVRERVHAALVLLARAPGAFGTPDLERLRALAPTLSVADALLARLEDAPRASSAVRLYCLDERLTERQRQLVEHVALGHSNAEIAAALELSPNTVRNHLARVFARLGASNRADLVRLAVLIPNS
jgi:DNA-binding CsgD family transcriptional regulator